MNDDEFQSLEEVIVDPLFAVVDTDLRQGRHINLHETERYTFLRNASTHLERFYRLYGWELRNAANGYFHLVPDAARLPRRKLTTAEMLVGQALALMYLDPETLRNGGIVTNDDVVRKLVAIVGEERLVAELNPHRRRHDTRVAEGNVRNEVEKALRSLTSLGFVETQDANHIRLGRSVLRFADPVHGLDDHAKALERLIANGLAAEPDAGEIQDDP